MAVLGRKKHQVIEVSNVKHSTFPKAIGANHLTDIFRGQSDMDRRTRRAIGRRSSAPSSVRQTLVGTG